MQSFVHFWSAMQRLALFHSPHGLRIMCDVTIWCSYGFVSLLGILAETTQSVSADILGFSQGTMVRSMWIGGRWHPCTPRYHTWEGLWGVLPPWCGTLKQLCLVSHWPADHQKVILWFLATWGCRWRYKKSQVFPKFGLTPSHPRTPWHTTMVIHKLMAAGWSGIRV